MALRLHTLLDLYENLVCPHRVQTDLDRRVHRNQSTNALGKMSFGIYNFSESLTKPNKIDRIPSIETFYRRFEVENGSYNQLVQEVVEEEKDQARLRLKNI